MGFSCGSLVIQPLPKDFVKHDKNSRMIIERPQPSIFNLEHSILAFAAFGKAHLLGVGREGCIYTFDISTDEIKIPNNTKLENVDDIYAIQPLSNRHNHFFIATNKGLHVINVQANPKGIVKFNLCPSDEGNAALSCFPFHDEKICGAVEIDADKVLVAVEGRARLYVIDIATRQVVAHIDNPSGSTRVISLMKHPAYDAQRCPYVVLQDDSYISLIDVQAKNVMLLVKATNTME
jgi:hypothetical protein